MQAIELGLWGRAGHWTGRKKELGSDDLTPKVLAHRELCSSDELASKGDQLTQFARDLQGS